MLTALGVICRPVARILPTIAEEIGALCGFYAQFIFFSSTTARSFPSVEHTGLEGTNGEPRGVVTVWICAMYGCCGVQRTVYVGEYVRRVFHIWL